MSHEHEQADRPIRESQGESAGAGPPGPAATALCPYCGGTSNDPEMCEACGGLFEPLSRQATQNAMGPWFIRDEAQPFRPGCAYATLKRLVIRGVVRAETIVRGPTTRQFWSRAGDAPGVAHLLGQCHNCRGPAEPDEYMCRACGAVFVAPTDRQALGLAPVRLLPGEAPPEVVAESALPARPAMPPARPSASAPPAPAHAEPTTPFSTPPPVARPAPALALPAPGGDPAAMQRLSREVGSLKSIVLVLAIVAGALMVAVVLLLVRTTGNRSAEAQPQASVAPSAPPPPTQPTPAELGDRMAKAVALGEPGTREALQASLDALVALEREAGESNRPAGLNEAIARLRQRLDEDEIRKLMK